MTLSLTLDRVGQERRKADHHRLNHDDVTFHTCLLTYEETNEWRRRHGDSVLQRIPKPKI